MIRMIRQIVAACGMLAMLSTPLFFPTQVSAAPCKAVNVMAYPAWYNGLQCEGAQPKLTKLNDTWVIAMNIVQWIIVTAGYAAVVFIIIGGFTYMTASGEPAKIAQAKNSVLYAVIGLVVALAAVLIVRTVQAAIVKGSVI